MTMDALHTNPTQLTGLFAFALAALACGRTAAGLHGRRAELWRTLAVLQALFSGEVLLGLRHRAHDGVDALLVAHGWYASRGSLQLGLVAAAVVLVLLLGWGAAAWRRVDPAATVPMLASALTLGLFAIEAISLHGIDAAMYGTLGPLMHIAWLWAGLAALVVAGALRVGSRRPTRS